MKINVILANSSHDPFFKQYPFMPLIMPILKAAAPEHEYTFTDLLWEDNSTIDYEADYDLIALSFRVSATTTAFEIADRYRKHGKTVVMGGPQASSIPLRAKEHADAVVVGEGETVWPILLNDFQNNQLKDFYLAYPRSDLQLEGFNVYKTADFQDITSLPAPVRIGVNHNYTFDMVYYARGCPVNCSFCAVSRLFGTKMRFRNIADVVKEIDSLGRMFFLYDDTVFGRNGSYQNYKELYIELEKLPRKRFWTGQANLSAAADEKGREVITLASKAGLTYAAVGFETINMNDMQFLATLPKMGVKDKSTYLSEIQENIRFIQEQGVAMSAWFTIGLENDTYQSVIETINFCIINHLFPVLTPIQALEGTDFYEDLKAKDALINQESNVSNANLSKIKNTEYIELLRYSLKKAYSFSNILRNTLFYYKKNRMLKRGHFTTIYRTIFTLQTQRKMISFLKKDIKRFELRITHNV